MRSLFSWWRKSPARQRSVRKRSFLPAVEVLETRDTPAIAINAAGTLVLAVGDNGGVAHNDTFDLRFPAGSTTLQMRQFSDGQLVATRNLPATVTQITVNGGGGIDAVQ